MNPREPAPPRNAGTLFRPPIRRDLGTAAAPVSPPLSVYKTLTHFVSFGEKTVIEPEPEPEPARASPSRRSPTRLPTERKPESPVATEVRTRPSAAADEIRLEGLGLTAVPPRLGEDRPGRVRPRKVDLSDNKLSSLAGLPQSVVQLRAANNVLRDWEGLQTLPRCGAHLVTDPLPPS